MQRNKSVCKILKRLVISFDCCRKREFQYWDPCKLSFVLLNAHHLWPCSNGSSDSWFHDRKFRNHKAVLCWFFWWINPGWSRQRRVSKMVKTCLQSTISCSEFLYLSALTSLTALGVAQNLCDKGLKGQFRIFSALDLRIMSQCSHPVVHHASLAYTEPRASKTVARVKIGWQHLTTTMYTFIDSYGYQNVCYIMLHVFKYNIYSKYKQLNLVGHSQSWNLLPLIARVSDAFQHLFVSLPVICGSEHPRCFQKIELTISFQLLLCHGAIFEWLPICRNPQQAQNNIAAS